MILRKESISLRLTSRLSLLLSILLCSLCVSTLKIPCEYVNPEWDPNLRYPISQRELLVSTRYHYQMIVDSIDGAVSQTIKKSGTWQPSNMRLIAYFLKKGFKVLNLGPQTGLEAIMIGKLIGSSGELFIFEPNSVSYSMVKKNIYLNDLEEIAHLYQVGASDIQAQGKMLIQKENTGGAQIFLSNAPPVPPERQIMSEIVQVDLVDAILPEDVKIDFVLMDVQKMQVEALLGMQKLIQRSKNIIILFQWSYNSNSKRSEAKTRRLLSWLSQMQFKVYHYVQNELNRCSIGAFHPVKFEELLILPVLDFLLIPKHIDPANYKQQQ